MYAALSTVVMLVVYCCAQQAFLPQNISDGRNPEILCHKIYPWMGGVSGPVKITPSMVGYTHIHFNGQFLGHPGQASIRISSHPGFCCSKR